MAAIGRSTSTFPNYYEVVNYKILTFQDKEFPPPLITRPSILGLHFNFKAFQRYQGRSFRNSVEQRFLRWLETCVEGLGDRG